MEQQQKRGRKAAHHHHSKTGKQIFGLGRSGNRWRIIASNQFFSAPDEDSAIAKFYRLTGQAIADASLLSTLDDSGATTEAGAARISGVHFHGWKQFWEFVADKIRTQPKLVAKETGIEEIAYLKNLKAPEATPSFAALRKLYDEKTTATKDSKRQVLKYWDMFTKKVHSVEEVTAESCKEFRDYFFTLGQSDKSASHCFNSIRRIFNFAVSEAVAIEELTAKLACLQLMKPKAPPNESINAILITKEELQKLLKGANPTMKAMILLCLNGAFSLGEVLFLRWDEIKDGCIVTRRRKKGRIIRACVLWEETKAALELLPKKATHIFSYAGAKLHRNTAGKWFLNLTEAVKLTHITGSHFRDSAQTVSTQANVDLRLVDIMAGHKVGITDKYIARNPLIVKAATDSVYNYYFK